MSRRVDRVRQALEDEVGALDVQDPRHMYRLVDAALRAADLSVGSAISINVTSPPAPIALPVRAPRPCPNCGVIS